MVYGLGVTEARKSAGARACGRQGLKAMGNFHVKAPKQALMMGIGFLDVHFPT